jgi:hypothetical protein
MRPSCTNVVGALALLLLTSACSSVLGTRAGGNGAGSGALAVDRDTQVAVLLASTLQALQRLAAGNPAEQAEIVASARQGYERAPGGGAQMRYALALATPGHAGRDPERARQLLRELAAEPEVLAPVERALTFLELGQLDRELGLKIDNDRLQGVAGRAEQERLAAANRRMQVELDENARLRRQLADAQAKLDAIANIERTLTERKTNTGGLKQ